MSASSNRADAISTLYGGMDRPRARRFPWVGMSAVAILAAAAIGGAVALLGWSESTLRVDRSRLTIATVASASFQDFIPLRGQVMPLRSVALDVAIGGHVEAVLAQPGQQVRAGQPLVRLSDPNLELEAIAREASVIQEINDQNQLAMNFAATQVNDAKAVSDADYNIRRLTRSLARRSALVAMGYVTLEQRDQIVDELTYQRRNRVIAAAAQADDRNMIRRGRAQFALTAARLQDNLEAARRMAGSLVVRAPVDGVLTALDALVGEEKIKGQHLGQVDRNGGTKVTVDVNEFYLPRIALGQHVTVAVDGTPRQLTVMKIYPQVKDGKLQVDLGWVGDAPGTLRRGQSVQGSLELGDPSPTLVVNAGPFVETAGDDTVFVLDSTGQTAHRRKVSLGRRTSQSVEILSGLNAGDRVVVSAYTGLDHIDVLVIGG